MVMAPVYRLKQDLGADRPADMDDVWVTKQNLHLNGYYEIPEYGLTPYPDRPLFESIRKYQAEHDLQVDGVMKPGGETESHMLNHLAAKSPTFRCACGAWYGGAFGKICRDCWVKQNA